MQGAGELLVLGCCKYQGDWYILVGEARGGTLRWTLAREKSAAGMTLVVSFALN